MRLFFRDHDSAGHIKRVWAEGWPGDVFEVLSAQEFAQLRDEITESRGTLLGRFITIIMSELADDE